MRRARLPVCAARKRGGRLLGSDSELVGGGEVVPLLEVVDWSEVVAVALAGGDRGELISLRWTSRKETDVLLCGWLVTSFLGCCALADSIGAFFLRKYGEHCK